MVPEGLEGDLLHFNELCISLQRRTDDCLLKAEQGDRTADQLSLQWEEIVGSLESSTIHDVVNPEPELSSPWTGEYSATITAGNRLAPGSAGSEGGKERRERQSFWEATFGKESKFQRPYNALDTSQASPPSRGQSRNGKQSRSFLSGLKRKGKGEGNSNSVVGSFEKEGSSPGNSFTGGSVS
jgi:hypothetical protein